MMRISTGQRLIRWTNPGLFLLAAACGESGDGDEPGSTTTTEVGEPNGGGTGDAPGGRSGIPAGGGGAGPGAGGTAAGGTSGTPEVAMPPLELGIEPPATGTLTDDRDGRSYGWVELNGTRWMAENLHFEPAPGDSSSCYIDILSGIEDCETYGIYYGWSALHGQARIVDEIAVDLPEGTYQGICPRGWHIPTRQEWVDLIDFVGVLAGQDEHLDILGMERWNDISAPFRSTTGWSDPVGTNELGFNVLPFNERGDGPASFWASDEAGSGAGWTVEFSQQDFIFLETDIKVFRHGVRCVEGEAVSEFPTVEFARPGSPDQEITDDRDGTTYRTTQIGEQLWFAENLNFEVDDSDCFSGQLDHCRLFGRLYSYTAAQTACPSGWHLPSRDEWHVLAEYVDSQTEQLGRMDSETVSEWQIGQHLIGGELWGTPPETPPMFGFHALPVGFQSSPTSRGAFLTEANFWTGDLDDELFVTITGTRLVSKPVGSGFYTSVRCLQD